MDSQNNAYYTSLLSGGSTIDDPFLTNEHSETNEDSPTVPQFTNTPSIARRGQRGTNFAIEDDLLLISAYLNTSLDPVQGNQQKLGAYWERIENYYNENKQDVNIVRSKVSLQHRWSTLQREVNKFCGHFAKIDGRQQSGVTEQDKIMQAQIMFKQLESHSFQFLHCWYQLRHHPKWMMENSSRKANKKTKNSSPQSSPPTTPDSINLEEDENVPSTFDELERPLGRKASKERHRKGKTQATSASTTSSAMMIIKFDEECTKREARYERAFSQQQGLIDIEKKKYRIKEAMEEERIMLMDTASMPPGLATYYERRKAEILARQGLD
ncbi:glutathione S-transferase T3-like [Tripterygium wilfordii]|uniref:glutathione S-transferase T3-like n=1 Tax=Tripterygium wilfordii TaxID=458696 RepID=UPI0018F845C6|nr:glutathione S-transferase T3-like [Tripterygium wilfordii]